TANDVAQGQAQERGRVRESSARNTEAAPVWRRVGAASAGETVTGGRRRETCRSSTLFSCHPARRRSGSARASGAGAGPRPSNATELKRGEIQNEQRSQ